MKTKVSEDVTNSRILYVDDDEDSQVMLALLLKQAGYVVTTASSITDGLRLAGLESFDIYILDSMFADGRGIDLCTQIRAFDKVAPIIFYSGLAYPSDITAGLGAGAQRYLTKPMGIYTMTQTITELLNETNNMQLDVKRASR